MLKAVDTLFQTDDGWHVTQSEFLSDEQHRWETNFTIGNGYFCTRGSLAEGYPGEQAVTFAHGIYNDAPVINTELANLPNWRDLNIWVNGHRFRLDLNSEESGETFFRRTLDLRGGILARASRWRSPDGTLLEITVEQFISYTREHLAAMRILITVVEGSCDLLCATGINGHVANRNLLHLEQVDQGAGEQEAGEQEAGGEVWLHCRTRDTQIDVAMAARVAVHGVDEITTDAVATGQPTIRLRGHVASGETVQIDKIVSLVTGRDADDNHNGIKRARAEISTAALRLSSGQVLPHSEFYERLRAEQVATWSEIWDRIDVQIEGTTAEAAEAQLAMRFSLFQLQIAAPQHNERVSIGAKTLSGYAYAGHVFWDNEIFVLPFFIHTQPRLARNLLMYRYHTLAGARRKAAEDGFRGAQFAWESADTGDETTPTWVVGFNRKELVRIWTGDIEIHITADVAYALWHYWQVTGDDDFMRDYGAEIFLDTARFWASRAERVEQKTGYRYEFTDVIGPDEYHDHVDNNAFTNRMAQWHLQHAQQVWAWLAEAHPSQADRLAESLDLTDAEFAKWQDVIDHVFIPHDVESGLITQFDGFFERKPVDWAQYKDVGKSMQVVLGIEGANEHQVLKQADVIMLLCLLRDEYDQKTWQVNWDAYMPLTDHRYGSSLGPSFHAWAACEMGRPDEALDHFMLAARTDLDDVRGNAGEGIHAANAGGLWQATVFGFAGLQLTADGPTTRNRLPTGWTRVAFKVVHRGEVHEVEVVA